MLSYIYPYPSEYNILPTNWKEKSSNPRNTRQIIREHHYPTKNDSIEAKKQKTLQSKKTLNNPSKY